MSNAYWEVAVAAALPQALTYKAPQSMAHVLAPGLRVLVPLGRRLVTGYLLEKAQPPQGFSARDIQGVLDSAPLFPESLIPFFRWIADYYFYPLGQVIKEALPSGINNPEEVQCAITDEGRNNLLAGKVRTLAQRAVLKELAESGPALQKELCKRLGPAASKNSLAALEKNGWISRDPIALPGRVRPHIETFVIPQKESSPAPARMKGRHKILALLKEQGAMTDLELKKAIPSAKKWLPVMKDEGEVAFEERQVCRNPFGEVFFADSPPEKLFLEQQKALDEVAAALDKGVFETFLLHGVTGSGKTEVYLQAVDRVLKKGGNALILVPEIALITQMEQRVRARFGDRVAVLHSGLTPGERLDQWMRIHKGEAPVTVGARSGIFAPYQSLSLIVVDEEHDESYKQDGHLRYNARDLAVLRARMNNAVTLLGSATPSLTSRHNVTRHKFTGLEIKSRIEERPFPKIEVVDLKHAKASKTSLVSPALRQALEETLSRGEQALVFLNRRGFANLPLCADCGQPLVCEQCDIALTYHQQEKLCLCHYCGFKKALPTPCQACGSPALRMVGTGTQKVEQYLLRCFPKANIARLDRDAAASRSSLIDILKGLKDKSLDIVVGTQMITKGHDFPNVTLVGILCADLSLGFPDFKASERTFQILCQVSGRAGRGENPGSVILQTYNPEHFCITLAQKNDYNSFYKAEMTHRRELGYPPYARLAQIRISGQDPGSAAALARDAGNLCRSLCLKSPGIQKSVIVLGPIVSPIARIAGRFRWQILLKGLNTTAFRTYLAALAQALPALSSSKKAQAVIDVDPVSML